MRIPNRIPSTLICGALLLAACDRDDKTFGQSDLDGERSLVVGRAMGLGDSGLAGVAVTAQAVDAEGIPLSGVPERNAISGANGSFSLEVPPGRRWKVRWQSPDYVLPGNGEVVEVGLRQVVTLPKPVRLKYRYGWIRGTVPWTGGVPAGLSVDGQEAAARANSNGGYEISRVLPGAVRVYAVVPGKGYAVATGEVAAEDTLELDLSTTRAATSVAGTLVGEEGGPVGHAILSALGGLVKDTTDAQGRFRLGNLPGDAEIAVEVLRGTDRRSTLMLSTPPDGESLDLDGVPLTRGVGGPGVSLQGGVAVGNPGEAVALTLSVEVLDTSRRIVGYAWDTTGRALRDRAIRTWGPRLSGMRVGSATRAISAWTLVAAPSGEGFDTLWSEAARLLVVARQVPPVLDSIAPVVFSAAEGAYEGPVRLGLSTTSAGATVMYSYDSLSWARYTDSLELYDTTRLWAYAWRKGAIDSRVTGGLWNVRLPARPDTLRSPISGRRILPQGSNFVATVCPDLAANSSLVIDSGATLTVTATGCQINVNENATFELRAGSTLRMAGGGRILAGQNTSGILRVQGRPGRRAAVLPIHSANPLGGYDEDAAIMFYGFSGGSIIEGLDLSYSKGVGVLVSTDAEVDVVRSRIHHCGGAAIAYRSNGRPATEEGIAEDTTFANRWSASLSAYALARLATNPGFGDTVQVTNDAYPMEIATWHRQPVSLRVEDPILIQNDARVTIEAGTRLAMAPTAGIRIGNTGSGTLVVDGAPGAPVRMYAVDRGNGFGIYPRDADGGGIYLDNNASGVILKHLHLSGASTNGVFVDDVELVMQDCRLDSNVFAGVKFYAAGRPVPEPDKSAFFNIAARGNRWSVHATPTAFAALSTCDSLADSLYLEGGTISGENFTWSRQSMPTAVAGGIYVGGGASLTLEAGLHLLFDPDAFFRIGNTRAGTLVVAGTADDSVRLGARTVGGWGAYPLDVDGGAIYLDPGTIQADFQYLSLSGMRTNGIRFASTPPGVGRVEHVRIELTAAPLPETFGISLDGNASLAGNPVGYVGTMSP